jgi:hypothetical protein
MSVNNLPIAYKVSETAVHGSNYYCTVCNCYDQVTMYNSDFNQWKPRDVTEMYQQVEAWQDAQNSKERDCKGNLTTLRRILDLYLAKGNPK